LKQCWGQTGIILSEEKGEALHEYSFSPRLERPGADRFFLALLMNAAARIRAAHFFSFREPASGGIDAHTLFTP
jgi:hypothetical protein